MTYGQFNKIRLHGGGEFGICLKIIPDQWSDAACGSCYNLCAISIQVPAGIYVDRFSIVNNDEKELFIGNLGHRILGPCMHVFRPGSIVVTL